MSKKIILSCGDEVEIKSLSWEAAGAHLDNEEASGGDMASVRAMMRATIEEVYGKAMFAKAAASNQDVNLLYHETLRETFGLPGEIKNS